LVDDRPGLNLEEALEYLNSKGIKVKKQGLTRYLRNKEIKGYKPLHNYPKSGWKVDEESLEDFVKLKTMSINQLRVEYRSLKQENERLKRNSNI